LRYSGRVRDAFIARGHDAMSCDLLPTESPGPHYQGDVFDVIGDGWDLMIAHPPCTYLTNAGVRWLYVGGRGAIDDPSRIDSMRKAAEFFNALSRAPIDRIAIENPIMHARGRQAIGVDWPTQIIQPWQFGHGETKATCLWLKGLPKLTPTNIVDGRDAKVHRMPPGPDRWKNRSRTYQGIADAMASQWPPTNPEPQG
jgi:hypothetical protein